MPKKTHAHPQVPFDNSSFAALMHSAENTHSVVEDECPECGEHMLDCECDEVVEELE